MPLRDLNTRTSVMKLEKLIIMGGYFNDFFIKLDRKPNAWEDRVALFIAYLIDKKQPEQTITT